jgi:hypothetical protein
MPGSDATGDDSPDDDLPGSDSIEEALDVSFTYADVDSWILDVIEQVATAPAEGTGLSSASEAAIARIVEVGDFESTVRVALTTAAALVLEARMRAHEQGALIDLGAVFRSVREPISE